MVDSWQRLPNPPFLWRRPYFMSPPTFTPTAISDFFNFWLNGWLCHIWCVILLNAIVGLYMSSLGNLVPEGPCYVFYATRRQFYWGLIHNLFFCWCSDFISHKHTHAHAHSHTHTHKDIEYTQGPIDWYMHIYIYIYIYILTPPSMWPQFFFCLLVFFW